MWRAYRADGERQLRPYGGGQLPRHAAAWAALLLASGCSPGSPGPEAEQRPRLPEARRWASVSWDTVFLVGGSPADTLFLLPTRLAANEAGVSVLDRLAGRVVRFDRRGRHVWSFGRRGRGPDELEHPRHVALDGEGRTWVLDVENGRLTVIDTAGRATLRIPLGKVGRAADTFVPVPGDEAMLLVLDRERPLVHVGRNGDVRERIAFPWPGYADLHPLATQLVAGHDPASGRWVAAFGVGDGFFPFDGDRWLGYRGWYVEPIGFPRVVRRGGMAFGRRQRTTWLEGTRFAAEAISVEGGRLFVFFGGASVDRHRVVDVYSLTDGAYVESYRLPMRVRHAIYAGGLIYALYENPFPTLAAWRPRREDL